MTPSDSELTSIEAVVPDRKPTPGGGGAARAAGMPPSAFVSATAVSFTRGLHLALTLASGVLSAAYFGAGTAKDCYVVAQTLPSLLSSILLSGVYGIVLVALVDVGMTEGTAGQYRLVRRVLGQLGVVLAALCLAGTLFSRQIIVLIAPGFEREQLELSGRLLPLTMFAMAAAVGFAVLRALCNARHHFALPGFINLIVGLVGFVSLVLLVSRLGIFAQAIGHLLGTCLALIALGAVAAFVLRDPPGFVPRSAPEGSAGRRLWRDFLPMAIGANFGQVNLLIDNAFASYLPAGSITQLGFASVIFTNAEFLTIFALAEVAFARFTAADRRGHVALEEELGLNLRYMLLLAAPIAAGCLAFGAPVVRLLFERGEFGPDSTASVARILACLAPEIIFMGYFACFWRILFARRRLTMLVWISLGAMTMNAAMNALLMRSMGIGGIALSTSFVTASFAVIMGLLMRRERLRVFASGGGTFALRVLGAAGLMGAFVFAWSVGFEKLFDTGRESVRVVEVASAVAFATLVYSLALQLQGIRAIPEALSRLTRIAFDGRRR